MGHELGLRGTQRKTLLKSRHRRDGQPHIYLVDSTHTTKSMFVLRLVPTTNIPTGESVITQQIDCDHSLGVGLQFRRLIFGWERFLEVQ